MRERSDEVTEYGEGTWSSLSCPTPLSFIFFFAFKLESDQKNWESVGAGLNRQKRSP